MATASEVTFHECTKENPMDINIADKVHQLKQHWTHKDVVEVEDYERFVSYRCLNCGHQFMVDFGD